MAAITTTTVTITSASKVRPTARPTLVLPPVRGVGSLVGSVVRVVLVLVDEDVDVVVDVIEGVAVDDCIDEVGVTIALQTVEQLTELVARRGT